MDNPEMVLMILDLINSAGQLAFAAFVLAGFGFLFGVISLMRIRRINKRLARREYV